MIELKNRIKKILQEETNNMLYYRKKNINENEIHVEKTVLKNICDSEKFCSTQGKITFGQLKAMVDSATNKRLFQHVGEGGFKATIRLLPWFLPQLAIAGFTGSVIRAINKILKLL